jgi:hypothetical protein
VVIRDTIFADAVAAIDTGNVAKLDGLISQYPNLVCDRLQTGEPGYFADPYLLWFIAENPIRSGRLPANIVEIAMAITDHLDALAPPSRQSQLNYAVALVATGRIPRESGVQIALIDALIARGAQPSGLDSTVAHTEMEAARRLIHHGAAVTLAAALALGLDVDAQRLLPRAHAAAKADALVITASMGLVSAVRSLLDAGADPNLRSAQLHSHASALHQAALNGHDEVCALLVNAGASLTARDSMWNGTPSGWAAHAGHQALAQRLKPSR